MKSLIAIMITILFSLVLSTQPSMAEQNEVVFAMCGPSIKQIKNINLLYEKSFLKLDRIKLLCVYHQDERIYHKPTFEEEVITGYQIAVQYAKQEKLEWVHFEVIKGKVAIENLYENNIWTPQFKKIFGQSQGIIFTGGSDIPPSVYGEENNLLTTAATPIRSLYECSFLFHLLGGNQRPEAPAWLESRPEYVILGICLGAQTLNVATGGNLFQDIPSQIYRLETIEQVLKLSSDKIHSSIYIKKLFPFEKNLAPAFHQIKLIGHHPWTDKMDLLQSDHPYVLSSHHQSIKHLGKDLEVAATSMDGKVIEAFVHSKYKNVLGVQFHPEYYPLYQKGSHVKSSPGKAARLNLRSFLRDHPPSMEFHQKLWKWFSEALLGI